MESAISLTYPETRQLFIIHLSSLHLWKAKILEIKP